MITTLYTLTKVLIPAKVGWIRRVLTTDRATVPVLPFGIWLKTKNSGLEMAGEISVKDLVGDHGT